ILKLNWNKHHGVYFLTLNNKTYDQFYVAKVLTELLLQLQCETQVKFNACSLAWFIKTKNPLIFLSGLNYISANIILY
ncbi:MAG: hypothetical protein ABI861_11945, partial [Panacibacter sp.]